MRRIQPNGCLYMEISGCQDGTVVEVILGMKEGLQLEKFME